MTEDITSLMEHKYTEYGHCADMMEDFTLLVEHNCTE